MGEKGLQLSKRGYAILDDWSWQHLKKGDKDWERGGDPRTSFNPRTGQNAAWDSEKLQWIDTKTLEGLTPSILESKP